MCVFAVRPELGLTCVEDIAARKAPLRISVRQQRDHCLHILFGHLSEALGFPVGTLRAWGGDYVHDGRPRESKADALTRGANAIFDEAVQAWTDEALDLGLTILSFAPPTIEKLEQIGYRRNTIRKADYPGLPADVPTVDFSGWAVFVHAEAPDDLITRLCAALEARRHLIPWQGQGPLPLDVMCRDTPDTPSDVPLHPAAERFWKAQGYI
jgi:hypothetical protein